MSNPENFSADFQYTKEDVINDLAMMVKAGLVDIRMREDGQWVYSATEMSKSLTDDQLFDILSNLQEEDLYD